jgi:hypothetical protein
MTPAPMTATSTLRAALIPSNDQQRGLPTSYWYKVHRWKSILHYKNWNSVAVRFFFFLRYSSCWVFYVFSFGTALSWEFSPLWFFPYIIIPRWIQFLGAVTLYSYSFLGIHRYVGSLHNHTLWW